MARERGLKIGEEEVEDEDENTPFSKIDFNSPGNILCRENRNRKKKGIDIYTCFQYEVIGEIVNRNYIIKIIIHL